MKELALKKGTMTVSHDIKSALTSWSNQCVVSYAPFSKIEGFADAPPPLMFNDHCLILEVFMQLKPNDEVMCLVK